MLEIHAVLQRLTGTPNAAWTLMALNVGAVMLARALPDAKLQTALLTAVRRAGAALIDQPKAPP